MAVFAVVGHPNRGKSSIVATLAENESVAISPIPGTTDTADAYTFMVDGVALYTLVDTPGFQRAKAVLDWLQAHVTDASDRPSVVRMFVDQHVDNPRFQDECTLLQPILDGAGILYVVDGAKPYGAEFELEMQILQWSGQPRMALINLIGEGRYVLEWQRALGQYFSIVRTFDAMLADFDTRLNLLRAFAELNEDWRGEMDAAISVLSNTRQRRLESSAREIVQALLDCLTFVERGPLPEAVNIGALDATLREKLFLRVRRREQQARDSVQTIYRHQKLERHDSMLSVMQVDIFTTQAWELFGLSRQQLLITGAMTGAAAGLGIDALVGGASLLVGTGIGALIGGVSSWFAGDEIAKRRVLGTSLGGRSLVVGPIGANNFPWVFLGRAWLHHHFVRERNHALRETISDKLVGQRNFMDKIPGDLRKRLAKSVGRVDKGSISTTAKSELQAAVVEFLAYPLIASAINSANTRLNESSDTDTPGDT